MLYHYFQSAFYKNPDNVELTLKIVYITENKSFNKTINKNRWEHESLKLYIV